jgi:toxin ParE1/3/4
MTTASRYAVEFTEGAEQDLDEIVAFVATNDSPAKASALLDRLLATAATLATAPQRGSVPRELQALGMREYRQTMFKPYRLIYTVREAPRPAVFVVVIADGRRDMASLLQRRLLAPPPLPAPLPESDSA